MLFFPWQVYFPFELLFRISAGGHSSLFTLCSINPAFETPLHFVFLKMSLIFKTTSRPLAKFQFKYSILFYSGYGYHYTFIGNFQQSSSQQKDGNKFRWSTILPYIATPLSAREVNTWKILLVGMVLFCPWKSYFAFKRLFRIFIESDIPLING